MRISPSAFTWMRKYQPAWLAADVIHARKEKSDPDNLGSHPRASAQRSPDTIFTRSASIRIALPTLEAYKKKFHVCEMSGCYWVECFTARDRTCAKRHASSLHRNKVSERRNVVDSVWDPIHNDSGFQQLLTGKAALKYRGKLDHWCVTRFDW